VSCQVPSIKTVLPRPSIEFEYLKMKIIVCFAHEPLFRAIIFLDPTLTILSI